jgi:23S rRNA (cytosine1962-C5)-methyltransferase
VRTLTLSKSGLNKLRSHQFELKASDFEESVKSWPPGEWFTVEYQHEIWYGFLNPLVEDRFPCAHLISKITHATKKTISPEFLIEESINRAWRKRNMFSGYETGARLFYGASDGLPGLIIDTFQNAAIIQINTSGIDRHRELVAKIVSTLTEKPSYLLDNPKYREKESLPTFAMPSLPDLEVLENGLRYKIRAEVLQKVGFYYDHRENRRALIDLVTRATAKPKVCVDLFSYAGAWGMSALKAGVQHATFVDQGDFGDEVISSLALNGFRERGAFVRSDVFKFLDEATSKGTKFDLVLCDPPAFAKSSLQKSQALEGYSKLHRKVFKTLAHNSMVAFSSCTHYISHEEFQKNVLDAAHKESKKIQLIYSGMQGLDHPVTSLEDKANYIKSYFYTVE